MHKLLDIFLLITSGQSTKRRTYEVKLMKKCRTYH